MRTLKGTLFAVLAVAALCAVVPAEAHAEASVVSHTPETLVRVGVDQWGFDVYEWTPETVVLRDGPFVRSYHVCTLSYVPEGVHQILYGNFNTGRCRLFGWQNEDGSFSMGGEITHGWSTDIEFAEYVSLRVVVPTARAAY